MIDFKISQEDIDRFNAGHIEYDDLADNTKRENKYATRTIRRLSLWLYILAGALSGSCGFWSFGILAVSLGSLT